MVLIRGFFAIIDNLLGLYLILLFIALILKMVRADSYNVIVRGIYVITDPPCRWISKKFPRLIVSAGDGNYIDLGPTVLMVLIGCIRIFLPYLQEFLFSIF